MFKRYFALVQQIESIHEEDLNGLLPSAPEIKKVMKLFQTLQKIDSATKVLQRDENDMADVWAPFDGFSKHFLEMESRLSPKAQMIHEKDLESAVAKIVDSKAEIFTSDEKQSEKFAKFVDF